MNGSVVHDTPVSLHSRQTLKFREWLEWPLATYCHFIHDLQLITNSAISTRRIPGRLIQRPLLEARVLELSRTLAVNEPDHRLRHPLLTQQALKFREWLVSLLAQGPTGNPWCHFIHD